MNDSQNNVNTQLEEKSAADIAKKHEAVSES